MEIQRRLGSDIAMVFDECPPWPCEKDYACKAVRRTLDWAAICREAPRAEGQLVFGIAQGSVHADLRRECAEALVGMDFDGYAIGGVSVGEPDELILRGVDDTVGHLPASKPRYLMGVGEMAQMVESVARGVDMFDCVIPTRQARNGTVSTRRGRYPVKAARYREDGRPLEEGCGCYACRNFTRAYVRHLLNVGEILGLRLITMHNLHCYLEFMRDMRKAIAEGRFEAFRADFHADYQMICEEHAAQGAVRDE
jgi:queuine tRNA-ribosyltransferase